DQWDIGLHAERGRIVDDPRAGRSGPRRPLERQRVVDVDHREVEAVEAAVAEDLAHNLASVVGQPAALGARRGVGAQVGHREVALGEDREHLAAHDAGRTDNADVHALRHASSSSNDWWSARTARSTSSSWTTHEIRIVEVEIISMLTPSLARVSNICAATPG